MSKVPKVTKLNACPLCKGAGFVLSTKYKVSKRNDRSVK